MCTYRYDMKIMVCPTLSSMQRGRDSARITWTVMWPRNILSREGLKMAIS